MKGLSFKATQAIQRLIRSKFDSLSLKILGFEPRIDKNKRITFSSSKENIVSLFLRALGTKNPNNIEEQSLKVLLSIASGYIDSLRDRTTAKIVNDVDSHLKNTSFNDQEASYNILNDIINQNMDKARNHIKLIASAESNKAVNMGTALQITKIADQKGQIDPVVFFIVTVDDVTGPEEFILHLLPDRKTPRVWKLSEIGSEYHKVGDSNPKLPGLHPNCRCKLTYLAEGWGFDDAGNIKYKGPDWDEYSHQREKHGRPR